MLLVKDTKTEGGGCDQGPCNSRSNSILLVRGDIHLACVYMNVSQVCISEGCKEVGTSLNPLLQRNTCDCPCLIYHLPDSEDRPAQSLWVATETQLQPASYIWHPKSKQGPIHMLLDRQVGTTSKNQETRGRRVFSLDHMTTWRAKQAKLNPSAAHT